MVRYKVDGPKINPVSAMSYKIWDKIKQDHVKHPDRAWDWEFLCKEDAEQETQKLNAI